MCGTWALRVRIRAGHHGPGRGGTRHVVYLTLPNFCKTLEELESLQDPWFYVFRHLHELTEQAANLNLPAPV